ncbi:GTP:AMP phosphotransferase AK3, mitochondrial [Frankliniella fusca]|uniref:GTP:AMP phosphotransferase, mitochondrial n=1 Tax=Frankliniella fusca TaxID=407009 RepID=A0AAE1LRJ3_9NEOP|nr:GTP:AMP phosphotransferase AK3, mitochondrial [Frankliniella fusca]
MAIGRLIRAVILGAPASGKGTISDKITKRFAMDHISSGDLLRWNIQNKTEYGQRVKDYMDKGDLVPDEVVTNLVFSELEKKKETSWLLDGFPRTEKQAVDLMAAYPVDLAINIVVPFEVIVERVQGRWVHLPSGRVYNTGFKPPKNEGVDDITGEPLVQRDDDKPEAVLKRLEIYKETVEPLCAFYRSKGILVDFPGRTSEQIWRALQKYLESRIEPLHQEK